MAFPVYIDYNLRNVLPKMFATFVKNMYMYSNYMPRSPVLILTLGTQHICINRPSPHALWEPFWW